MTRRCRRRGFKLVDMIVVIFVIGLLMGLLVPALNNSGHDHGRRAQCRNNLKNIVLALVQYYTVHNAFPQAGTIDDDPDTHQGDPSRSNVFKAVVDPAAFASDPGPLRSNWVVAILPYLDQQEL